MRRQRNSMIASLNSFLRFIGLESCCVKQLKVQRKIYCPEEKELTRDEYFRLINAAKSRGSERLSLLIETICATGIRVSELLYITAETVRHGEATVSCKGKTRTIFIPNRLQKKLLQYIKEQKIMSGVVFITRTGKPMNRCNIWREMKALCERGGRCARKGLSPQSQAFVRPNLLRNRKGYREAGRYFRSQQYQYNTHLYCDYGRRTPPEDRRYETDFITGK